MALVLSGVPQRKSVDIVVVGDASTGKTSLITTLVSSIFPEAVPRVLQQVRVPPEETADHIALSITDTSSNEKDRGHTLKQISVADVVVLVYAVDKNESFDRIGSYWLPEICKVFNGSIIVVGNKNDLLGNKSESEADDLRRRVEPLIGKFRQIDACCECSAKLNINVSDVFSLAQRAVVYPIAQIFDTQSHCLLPKFKTALKRVFRIFDQDQDGLLSDVELNDFQETCFGARLQPSDIEDVKTMLINEGADKVTNTGITFEGYLSIHKRFIARNRAETSWLVLRLFGYDDNLELQVPLGVLNHERFASWRNQTDSSAKGRGTFSNYANGEHREQSVELTNRALSFLADLFHQFDRDKDQALNAAELDSLFSICPSGKAPWDLDFASFPACPNTSTSSSSSSSSPTTNTSSTSFPSSKNSNGTLSTTSTSGKKASYMATSDENTLINAQQAIIDHGLGPSNSVLCNISDFPNGAKTDSRGNITLAGWLAEWTMITLLRPKLTLLYLYFLGFDRSKEEAIRFTRPRSVENENNNLQRNVVRAFVFGAHGVGKSSLLDALVGSTMPSMASSASIKKASNQALISPGGVSGDATTVTTADGYTSINKSNSAWTFSSGYHHDLHEEDRSSRNAVTRLKPQTPNSAGPVLSKSSSKSGNKSSTPEPRYFVLTEVGTENDDLDEALSNGMVDCDLAVLLFDSSNPSSVDWLRSVQMQIPENVPCVYVGTKADLANDRRSGSGVGSGLELQAIEEASALCAANNLPLPERISLNNLDATARSRRVGRLFELLLFAALRPDAARPISEEKRALQRRQRFLRATLRISLVSTVIVSIGLLSWSWLRPTSNAKSSSSSSSSSTTSSSPHSSTN